MLSETAEPLILMDGASSDDKVTVTLPVNARAGSIVIAYVPVTGSSRVAVPSPSCMKPTGESSAVPSGLYIATPPTAEQHGLPIVTPLRPKLTRCPDVPVNVRRAF